LPHELFELADQDALSSARLDEIQCEVLAQETVECRAEVRVHFHER